MAVHGYLIDVDRVPISEQRKIMEGAERIWCDHQGQLTKPLPRRTEGRMMVLSAKPGDEIIFYEWWMVAPEIRKLKRLLDKRQLKARDKDGREPPVEPADITLLERFHRTQSIAITRRRAVPSRNKVPPGWRVTPTGRFRPDKKGRAWGRALLALVQDYGLTTIDLVEYCKQNVTPWIAHAKHGFPLADEEIDIIQGMPGITYATSFSRRRAYKDILRELNSHPMQQTDLFRKLKKYKISQPVERLYELRCMGAVKRYYNTDLKAYFFERDWTWKGDVVKPKLSNILAAITEKPKSTGQLAKEFLQPQWFFSELFSHRALRRKIQVSRDRTGRAYYQLREKVEVNYYAIMKDLGLTSPWMQGRRTSPSQVHEADEEPFRPCYSDDPSPDPGFVHGKPFPRLSPEQEERASEEPLVPDD